MPSEPRKIGPRKIGVVTTSRADYGIYRPVLRRIAADPDLSLHLIVTGMHLVPSLGLTVREIEADGLSIAERVDMLLAGDTPEAAAKSMGLAMLGLAPVYVRAGLDLLLVLGDRFEMFAAAAASVPFNLPMAHIHGGELTLGAIDEVFRHGLTKLSHLHFPAAEEYGRRIAQMGEEDWRICVSGAPGLDTLMEETPYSDAEFLARFGVPLAPAPVLVTFHPATREAGQAEAQARELLAALSGVAAPLLFTAPNADPGGQAIARALTAFAATRDGVHVVSSLGSRGYATVLRRAAAMAGNSSSGIIEAQSFALPVVNIGRRQDGRLRAGNVIDVPDGGRDAIAAALARALDPGFRAGLAGRPNPYGDGRAAGRIVERLKAVALDERLLVKRFADR